MPRTATKPQLAKIQNVVVDDRINYALTIQDKYRKRLKTYSTDRSRVTEDIFFDKLVKVQKKLTSHPCP